LSPNDCFRCDACRMMQGPHCMQLHHHARARGGRRVSTRIDIDWYQCVLSRGWLQALCFIRQRASSVNCSALHVAAKAARCRISLTARPCSPRQSASCRRWRSAPSPRVPRGSAWAAQRARASARRCACMPRRLVKPVRATFWALTRACACASGLACDAAPRRRYPMELVAIVHPSVDALQVSPTPTSSIVCFRMPCRHCRRR
jgi:hypothetical protein